MGGGLTTATAPQTSLSVGTARRSVVLIVLALLLVALALLSLFVGSGNISPAQAWDALWHNDGSTAAQIVRTSRVPRTLLGLVCGAALGVAGAMMQALTRNPLADPGILGVNAGAYPAMVLGFWWFGAMSTSNYVLWGTAGALVASGLVYVVGSTGRAGASAGKLVLTGVAVSCVFTGIAFGLTMIDPKAFDAIRGWQAGSLQKSGATEILFGVLPYIGVGLAMALVLMLYFNALALGDDRARAHGRFHRTDGPVWRRDRGSRTHLIPRTDGAARSAQRGWP
ncbi:MAG: FecCD family ABC transporter permease [Cumulibacter sp.]